MDLVCALMGLLYVLSCRCSDVEPEREPEEVRPLSMAQLVPGLQPLVLWMANSIELLHFIQHEVPLLLPWGQSSAHQPDGEEHTEDELDGHRGTGINLEQAHSNLISTILAQNLNLNNFLFFLVKKSKDPISI